MSTFVLVEICDRPGPALRSVCEAETLEGIANRVDDLIEGRLGLAWNPGQGPVPAEPAVLEFARRPVAAVSPRVRRAIDEIESRRDDAAPLVIDVQ